MLVVRPLRIGDRPVGACAAALQGQRNAGILARSSQRLSNSNPPRSFCADGFLPVRPGGRCNLQFVRRDLGVELSLKITGQNP